METTTNHPLYEKARAAQEQMQGSPYAHSRVYLTPAEVAGLLRERLKREFPTTKFSVKRHCYSGGSSIDVRWAEGPLLQEVERVADGYSFARFDSSIDLKTYTSHWLLENGSLVFASTPGTAASGGYHPALDNPAPTAAAVKVGGGPDHVFCHRAVSGPAHCHVDHDRLPYGGPCPACGSPARRGEVY